jgi:hypothetical protein
VDRAWIEVDGRIALGFANPGVNNPAREATEIVL